MAQLEHFARVFAQDFSKERKEDLLMGYIPNEDERDPFVSLIDKNGLIRIPSEIDITNLVLKGIIYSEKEQAVILNNKILKERDCIGDYTILKIGEKGIILKKGKERFTLKLEVE